MPVGDLFLGLFPIMLLGGLFIVFILIYAWLNPQAPLPRSAALNLELIFNVLLSILAPAALIFAVWGQFGLQRQRKPLALAHLVP